MNLRRLVGLAAATLLAVGFVGQSAQGGSAVIVFDPTGTSSLGAPSGSAITIDQWNLANSNAVAENSIASIKPLTTVGQTGAAFNTAIQGLGNTFQFAGNPITLANNFTGTGRFSETPTLTSGAGLTATVGFTVNGGTATLNNITGTAFLSGAGSGTFQWNKITPGTTNMAAGTGFTPGLANVGTGTWFNVAGSSTSFTGSSTTLSTIQGTGSAFPTTTPSVQGAGSEQLAIFFANPNPAYFPNIPAGFGLLAVITTTVTPQFNGSTQTSAAFGIDGHSTVFGNVSGTNGGNNSTDTSGDFLFQATNPAVSFYLVPITTTTAIPEPSTMLLCAVGLGGLSLVRRLRRRRSA